MGPGEGTALTTDGAVPLDGFWKTEPVRYWCLTNFWPICLIFGTWQSQNTKNFRMFFKWMALKLTKSPTWDRTKNNKISTLNRVIFWNLVILVITLILRLLCSPIITTSIESYYSNKITSTQGKCDQGITWTLVLLFGFVFSSSFSFFLFFPLFLFFLYIETKKNNG